MGQDKYTLFLEVARTLARESAGLLIQNFSQERKIEYKGAIDLVTEMDRQSQDLIVEGIEKEFPLHSILGEEGENKKTSSPYMWVVDPLDGTTNYAHGFGFFAVSVALLKKPDNIIAAAVNAPYLNEEYTAVKGGGAFLNGEPIKVSRTAALERALLATGFPYDVRESGDNIEYFNRFLLRSQAVRRPGSAAIDLCMVAAGRFDGFWELKLSPWDTAAGVLIIREAGGEVSDLNGEKFNLYGDRILASNGLIHNEMKGILNE